MVFNYCPLCGGLGLTAMSEPDRWACMRCRHVFDLVDVIERAQRPPDWRHVLLPVLTDEELVAELAAEDLASDKSAAAELPAAVVRDLATNNTWEEKAGG